MDARGGSPLGLPPDLLMLAASPPDAEHDGAELYEPDGLSASSSAAGAAVAAAGKSTHEPSSEVFRAHLVRRRRADGSEQIDAEGVVSLACYQKWLDTRGTGGKGKPGGRGMDTPEKVFQRTLTGCLTAADGRRPFDPDEEAAILRTLRQKRIWPAFQGTELTIGARGYRGQGWHEKHAADGSAMAAAGTPRKRNRKKRNGDTRPPGQEEDDDSEGRDDEVAAAGEEDLHDVELRSGLITPSVSPTASAMLEGDS